MLRCPGKLVKSLKEGFLGKECSDPIWG